MDSYFIVLDHEQADSFVAGFADASLAIAFASSEAVAGRRLSVVASQSGEVLYTSGVAGTAIELVRIGVARLGETPDRGVE